MKYCILFFLLTASAVQSFAQQKDSSTIRHLDTVEVKGERSRREIIPVQVLNGHALRKLSVYSVADAIRYFSGVQVKDYGGIGGLKTVDVRSLGSHHVKVFYDEIEIGNAQNGVVDLGKFSLDNMEAVSLHNGQRSAILQSAKDFASASSVYLTARTPQVSKEKKDHYKVTVKGGSFGSINPSALWEHRWNDKISSAFNAEYIYTNGKYRFRYAKKDGYDTTEKRRNGDINTFRLEGTVFGKIRDGEWKAKLYWYRSERGYPGAAVREVPGIFPNQDRQWDNNFFAQASFRKHFSKLYTLQVRTKYAYDFLHYISDPRKDISTMYINNTYRQQELYVSAANLFNLTHWWSLNAAADISYNTLNADLVNFVYPRRTSTLGALSSSFTFNRLKLQLSMLGTFVHEEARLANSSAGNKQEYTPSLIFSWQPFYAKEFHFRAFYKRIFRMPSLNDLYYTQIGNKDLAPEFTTQYNTGFTYTLNSKTGIFRKLEPQVDIYFNKVKDKIVAMPTSNQFRWTMMNLGEVEINGVDFSMLSSWQFPNQLLIDTRFSYTYQKARYYADKTDPYNGGQIPYAPWHSGSVIVSPSWKTWGLHYSFIYTGERYSSVANIPENYVKPWYTHDLGIFKLIKKEKKEWRLSAELNNIFNQQYEVVQWYPMPGINYRLGASIQL
jgi:outer membrane cobalamin receptor